MLGKLKNYIQDYVTLAKLEGIEAVGKVAANIVYIIIMLLFFSFFILLGSFAAGYFLSEMFDRTTGFLIVTGFYLLLIILLVIFRKQFINAVVNIAIAASPIDKNTNE